MGVYGSWFANAQENTGLYIDSSLQYGWYKNKITGSRLIEESYNAKSWTASIELGYGWPISQTQNHQLILEPQAQLFYTHYRADNFAEQNGTAIRHTNGGKISGRIGARLSGRPIDNLSTLQPFVELNWYSKRQANGVAFNDKEFTLDTPKNQIELKTGLQGTIAKNWQVWGQVGGSWGKNSYKSYQGTVGVKYNGK